MEDFEDLGLEAKVQRTREAVIHLARAMKIQNEVLEEVYAHTQQHHDVINGLGRAVGLLEEMMIGGTDETPLP